MRLDLLLAREPFPDLFAATLGDYLRHRFGWQGYIDWHVGRGGRDRLLVNAKLNLIFPPSCPTDTLRGLAAEYAYHSNPVRRMLQGGYVRHAVTRLLRSPLACARIDIDPWPAALSDWCILAGNHSIRIVDMARDECVVLRKRGFREEFLDAVIALRREYPDLPGPRLLEWNAAEGWYAEERIAGLPLNRVANPDCAGRALVAARKALASLYQRTAQNVPVCDWLDDRLQRIAGATDGLPPIYGADVRGLVLDAAAMLANTLRQRLWDRGVTVLPTAVTHGDFQPANILVPYREADGPVYLIDWEYSDRRCRWYDALVFELRSRFPAGLAGRVVDWIRDDARMAETLAWCDIDDAGQWGGTALAASFLLDDLLLRLWDTSIPGLRQENGGFLGFLDELALLKLDVS